MIIAKINSAEDGCEAKMTVKGGFKTLVAEYTMIGVKLAEVFAEKDPEIAKVFETMIRRACEDGLLTDPEKAAKNAEEKVKKKTENTEKCEFTLKDALDKLRDMLELEELEK